MATGGELYDRIKQGNYTEALAAQVAKSILQMVAQCHAKHIVYRDIKPNNFLFFTKDPSSPLKATDFGLAVHYPPGSPPLQDTTGTPYYMAPELIRQEYGFEADLWSAGALIYQLLCGRVPFSPNPNLTGRNVIVDLFQRILNAPIDFSRCVSADGTNYQPCLFGRGPVAPHISRGKGFGETADDEGHQETHHNRGRSGASMVASACITEGNASSQPLDGDVVQRLQRYGTYGRFRQLAMVAALQKAKNNGKLALPWCSGNQEKLNELFSSALFIPCKLLVQIRLWINTCIHFLSPQVRFIREMDVDKNGVLSYEEISKGLDAAGYALAESEVKQLFMATDVNGTGVLRHHQIECSSAAQKANCVKRRITVVDRGHMQHPVVLHGTA
eukprot:scaffold336264_cov50-Prasinocladus_malaysianus.AAC.1